MLFSLHSRSFKLLFLLGILIVGEVIGSYLPLFFSGELTVPANITLDGLSIHLYSLFFALALFVGIVVARHFAKSYDVDEDVVDTLALSGIVSGFIGARLLYVLGNWTYYSSHVNEIAQFWRGGLSFYGGLVGGAVALVIVRYWKKIKLLNLLDVVAPALALGQAVGRWGNFFNQEAFGAPTALPWKLYIDPSHRPAGYEGVAFYHPTFLYESIGLSLLFIVLLFLREKGKRHPGLLFGVYAVVAGFLRFGVELLRVDPLLINGLKISAFLAILLSTAGLVLLFYTQHERKTT